MDLDPLAAGGQGLPGSGDHETSLFEPGGSASKTGPTGPQDAGRSTTRESQADDLGGAPGDRGSPGVPEGPAGSPAGESRPTQQAFGPFGPAAAPATHPSVIYTRMPTTESPKPMAAQPTVSANGRSDSKEAEEEEALSRGMAQGPSMDGAMMDEAGFHSDAIKPMDAGDRAPPMGGAL